MNAHFSAQVFNSGFRAQNIDFEEFVSAKKMTSGDY